MAEATGLKLRETLGWRGRAAAVESQAKKQVSEAVDVTKTVVEEKAQEVKAVVEKKVER